MLVPKTEIELENLISNKIEENLNLEYKAADALSTSEGKKNEIAKDVSSMANSGGGVIVYGIQEYNDKPKKHLPEKISPINRINFSMDGLCG